MPDNVECLVYLCAFLLRDGESLIDAAQADSESQIRSHWTIVQERGHVAIRDEAVRDLFYSGCGAEDVALARLLRQPEALDQMATTITPNEERFDRIPRGYIECLRCNALSPAYQKRMYSAVPCYRVLSMDTDHSPFFSAPDELVTHLVGAATPAP